MQKNASPTQHETKDNLEVEYLATSVKKIIWLTLLTVGLYQWRWFITNFYRYARHKKKIEHPVAAGIAAVFMFLLSLLCFIFLTVNVSRQAKAMKIKTWWHPVSVYILFVGACLASIPNNPLVAQFLSLSPWTHMSLFILFISLLSFSMAVMQQTINAINQQRELHYPDYSEFNRNNILAYFAGPILWFLIIFTFYQGNQAPETLAYIALKQGNYQHAHNLLVPAVDKGNLNAEVLLGYMYSKGLGVEKDTIKAEHYFDHASKSNNPQLLMLIANYYLFNAKQTNKGMAVLKLAANEKFAPAMNQLGAIYASGKRVPSHYQQALYYAQQSADLGNAAGEFLLAMLYFDNPQRKANWPEYMKYLQRSAKQGYPPAAYYLGLEYREGNPVTKKDTAQSITWLQVAANKKDPAAMATLATAYSKGTGVKKDWKKAYELNVAAANRGDVIAQYNLALSYAKGHGVHQDYKQALNWYTKAAQKNNVCAMNDLGILYSEGRGIAADDDSAKSYFAHAAEQGYRHTTDRYTLRKQKTMMASLRRDYNLGQHQLPLITYKNAYVIYMLSLHANYKQPYLQKLQQVSPLAMKEAKFLQQYFQDACWGNGINNK